MITKAKVFYADELAGLLERIDTGYKFSYETSYLAGKSPNPISLTLPLSAHSYHSNILFPFFDGLIPEGWLLDVATSHWKLKGSDRFELLVTLCRDTIGAVTIIGKEDDNE
jgi:serine/threonine-protein kinase HipA